MGWNGSGTVVRNNGTFTGDSIWAQEAAAPNDISATKFDTHASDLADAIENCLAKDGQNAATADIDLGTNKLKAVKAATLLTDAPNTLQVQNSAFTYAATVGGTANAITLTLVPATTANVAGQRFGFIAGSDNTAATTVNTNGVGNVNLYGAEGAALTGGEIVSGQYYEIVHDGTQFRLLPPANEGFQTWTPSYAANGSMTYTSVTTNYAKYRRQGKVVQFWIKATGTVGGTPDTTLSADLPVTPAATAQEAFAAVVIDNGTAEGGFGYISSTSQPELSVRLHDTTVYTAGTVTFYVSGSYAV